LQVVLPQFGVSDVGGVVERPAHGGLVLPLAAGCRLLHHSRLRLSLPGPLSVWRLRDTRRKLGTQPEKNRLYHDVLKKVTHLLNAFYKTLRACEKLR